MLGIKRYERLLRDVHIAGLQLGLHFRTAQGHQEMSALAGHTVFSGLDKAQAQVSGAIGDMARVHHHARELILSTGVDLKAFGETCDPKEPGVYRPTGAAPAADAA